MLAKAIGQLRTVHVGEMRARSQDDGRDRDLTPARIVLADGRGLGDVWVRAQHRLDLCRVDVLAARDDEVVAPGDDGQATFGIERPEVARSQPAIAEGGRRGRGIVIVAGEHGRATDLDATDEIDPAGRPAWSTTRSRTPGGGVRHSPDGAPRRPAIGSATPEAASVRPYVGTIGRPASSPRRRKLRQDRPATEQQAAEPRRAQRDRAGCR